MANSPLESPSLATLKPRTWAGRRIFVTGHTGFKGSWLSLWLRHLGADVCGYALEPETVPSMYSLCDVGSAVCSHLEDVRDARSLASAIDDFAPEVVFHLAAQPLVRRGYQNPVETFSTNVLGTVNLLEAVRNAPSVRAVVIVTTDKCYENREWEWPYREDDRLGGLDPYSGSKAAAEIVTASYRHSYFSAQSVQRHGALVASVRAGNVIGGGDWSDDRLIPDLVRASSAGSALRLRYPDATRPWQHVLEPLHGYLAVAESLLAGKESSATAWNFGPDLDGERTVSWLADEFHSQWGGNVPCWEREGSTVPHEASRLALDWSRARTRLGWQPQWDAATAVRHTVDWYKLWAASASGADLRLFSMQQIATFSTAVMTRD
jgi:CDP-glucose 4,6-dehydratase